MKLAGIINATLENTGGGPLVYRNHIQKSLKQKGYTVLLDEEAKAAPLLDICIGIETIPNHQNKPKTYVFDWGGLLHTTSIYAVNQFVGFKKQEIDEKTSLIGIFGDHEKEMKSKSIPYLEKKYWGSCYNKILGCNLDSYSKSALDDLLLVKRKKNNKPIVSVLFGGAPPSWIQHFVDKTLKKIKPLAQEDISLQIFFGNMKDLSHRPDLNYFLTKSNVKVFGALEHKSYLDEVFNSDLIITKPGWLTLSEMFYYERHTSHPFSILFLEDQASWPEQYSSMFLQAYGYKLVPENTNFSLFTRNNVLLRTKSILQHLDQNKKEQKKIAQQIKITDLMKLILENKIEHL